jgi:hypothetical protein
MAGKKKQRFRSTGLVAVSNVALTLSSNIQAASSLGVADLPDAPVWVQVATAGTYKGYHGGEMSFTFDLPLFKQVVANFRRSPNYRLGQNGVGVADVIAWDFHHASEMPAVAGTIPATGAPAQGWIQELDARKDESTGVLSLWALTRWLEPARTYIKEERYKWASVSIVFDAVDARTAENLGAILTSVALTNQPFIEGMQALAADRAMAGKFLEGRGMYIESANTPEEALESLRRMLGLPETADAVAVIGEIGKVAQWVSAGEAPLGIDLSEIVGGMRTVFNLPALASNEEVMVEVSKLISRLQEGSGVDAGGTASSEAKPAAPAPAASNPPGAPALQRQKEEETMEFLKALAEKLGVVATEKAVLDALDGHTELRAVVASAHGLDSNSSMKVILKAQVSDTDVRAKFVPLLKALGVEDPDAALDKVGDLMTQSEELKKVAPELAALRKKSEEGEAAAESEDVEAAMASMGIAAGSEHYEGIKLAVAHYRKTNKRDAFLAKYPKVEEHRAYLQRSISATVAGDDPKKVAASRAGSGAGPKSETPKDSVDVSAFTGVNLMMKSCEFVRASVTGATNWPWDKVHSYASALVRSKKVHMGEAA